MARTGSQRAGILCMIDSRARLARLFFGSRERILASKERGGLGENPNALKANKMVVDRIKTRAGRLTLQRTYFFTTPNSQSCRIGACRSRTKRNRIVHMKRPAKRMPMAMSTPSWEKPIEPLKDRKSTRL